MSYIRLFPQSFSRYDKHSALQFYLLYARGGHHIISELIPNSLYIVVVVVILYVWFRTFVASVSASTYVRLLKKCHYALRLQFVFVVFVATSAAARNDAMCFVMAAFFFLSEIKNRRTFFLLEHSRCATEFSRLRLDSCVDGLQLRASSQHKIHKYLLIVE